MTYAIASTPTYLVDHEHLAYLDQQLSSSSAIAVVIGFGEYAKHLINLHPGRLKLCTIRIVGNRELSFGTSQ